MGSPDGEFSKETVQNSKPPSPHLSLLPFKNSLSPGLIQGTLGKGGLGKSPSLRDPGSDPGDWAWP